MSTARITIAVNTEVTYQTMESFGASGGWWAQYVGGWDKIEGDSKREVREELAILLYDRERGIGLTNYRYNVGAGSADSMKGIIQDVHRRASSFETAPKVYDWNRDATAVWFMKKAVELGAEEIVFFVCSAPERLTINGMAYMDEGSKVNLLPEHYEDFAVYVMDVAQHFVKEGMPVKYISPINEPQWFWYGRQEGCHYEPAETADIYRVFLEELETRPELSGAKLAGPESGEWKGDTIPYTAAILQDTILKQHFQAIDNHSYWTDAAEKQVFKAWMNEHHPDVKLRMSEWCEMVDGSDYTMDSAFNLAEVLVEDLTILEVISWQIWVAIGPVGHRNAVIYVDEELQTYEPLKRLWGYGNYTRFIRPGYTRVEAVCDNGGMEELKPVAFHGVNEDGKNQLVLVLLNRMEASREVVLGNMGAIESYSVSQYETSMAHDLVCTLVTAYSQDMVLNISPMSITTVVLTES